VDLFRVTLAAGQTITIDIDAKTLSGGSSLDSYLRLFNSAGQQLAANDDDGSSFDSLLTFRASTAGTYFVGISGYGNSGYNPTRAGSGRAGSTGVYQVQFALTGATANVGVRIAGFRDTAAAARASAFAIYGANWSAAVPATPASAARLRRR
jgi:type IV secretory pathway TrbL component